MRNESDMVELEGEEKGHHKRIEIRRR